MTICIDWGNTRVKVGLFNEANFLIKEFNFGHDEAVRNIGQIIEERNIVKGILCSVADVPQVIMDFFTTQDGFLVLDNSLKLPILNAYQTPDSLGMDRIACVVAASHYNPNQNNLVISVGTALVFSFITNTNFFRGGSISPGVSMRLRAMHEFTANLPLISKDGFISLVGYDTESSLRSGAVNGVINEIDATIQAYQEQFKDINVTITGGDATLLVRKLKSKIFADPDLILKGLNLIYNYNAK